MIKGTVLPLLYTGLAIFVVLCAVLYLLQEQLIFLRPPLADSDRQRIGRTTHRSAFPAKYRGGYAVFG